MTNNKSNRFYTALWKTRALGTRGLSTGIEQILCLESWPLYFAEGTRELSLRLDDKFACEKLRVAKAFCGDDTVLARTTEREFSDHASLRLTQMGEDAPVADHETAH